MTMAGLKMIQVGTDVHDNPVYNVVKEDGKLATTTRRGRRRPISHT
jgi:hypothetical protein